MRKLAVKIGRLLKDNKLFTVLLLLILAVFGIAIFAPYIVPYDPYKVELTNSLLAPSSEHILGTDVHGRDQLSRIILGTRASVFSAISLVIVVAAGGTLLGVIAGFFGGIIDTVIMRLADTMISFPDLVLAIAIAGILGPDLINSMIAIGVVSWTKYARLSRSLVLKIRSSEYIAAARVIGTPKHKILTRHLLPNTLPTMIITATMDIGTIMLALASLSFLGFGIQPPDPEWGFMLSEGRQYFQTAPWLLTYPGLAIFIVVVLFNLLGDSLRNILDPKDYKQKVAKKTMAPVVE